MGKRGNFTKEQIEYRRRARKCADRCARMTFPVENNVAMRKVAGNGNYDGVISAAADVAKIMAIESAENAFVAHPELRDAGHWLMIHREGVDETPAETREKLENPPVSLELTGDESDAIADMLKIALDDQMSYHDSGDMHNDCTGVDFLNRSVRMMHVANVLMRMGKAYTSGMFQALSNDLRDGATEAKGEPETQNIFDATGKVITTY